MSYRDDLQHELTAVGITGRLRARITDEFADHLDCNPDAALGEPGQIARQFADELGTARARRASFAAFAALAVAGIMFAVVFLVAPRQVLGAIPQGMGWPGRAFAWVAVIAPQLAFAAGMLAVLRALHRRRAQVIAAAETRMLLRRATVGVVTGVASMAGVAGLALELNPWLASSWVTLTLICMAVGTAALIATLPALLAARRVSSSADGDEGDLFDDIGAWTPHSLEGHPWRVALLLAGAIFVLLSAAGWAASDGPDGMMRGVGDGLVCMLGFATLGRYLGLWHPARA